MENKAGCGKHPRSLPVSKGKKDKFCLKDLTAGGKCEIWNMKQSHLDFLWIAGLSLLAGGLWYYEVNVQLTMSDDSWLRVNHWSPYFIIALMMVSYLLPGIRHEPAPASAIVASGIEIYLTLLVTYFLTRTVLFSLYTGFSTWLTPPMLWMLLGGIVLMTSYNIFLTTRRRLFIISLARLPLLVAALVAPIALSLLLGFLLLGTFDGVEVARTGLPQALLTLGLGWAGRRIAHSPQPLEAERQDDILDDPEFRP